MDRHAFELILDSVMGFIITANALFIGCSMDLSDGSPLWIAVDVFFSLVFCSEIALKLSIHGFAGQFCGKSRWSNMYDASLIFIDVGQMVMFVVGAAQGRGGMADEGFPNATLFRLARLGKLTRILRLLRAAVFKDLLAMLQGMMGGMATLGWSMVLFVMMIYVIALVLREALGRDTSVVLVSDDPVGKEIVQSYFDGVPRSMFTMIRCSFGDCTDIYGIPIFERVNAVHGFIFSSFYCGFLFVVTIGLFNVISAIFVESTLEAAQALHLQKKKARLQDETLWCNNVSLLVKRLLYLHEGIGMDVKMTDIVDEIYELDVPCSQIDDLSRDPVAIQALNALDIVPEDRDYLSDILDPDNGGTINVIELVEGLRRLRGEPRRSDIVTVNLMLRSLQHDIASVHELCEQSKIQILQSQSTVLAWAIDNTPNSQL